MAVAGGGVTPKKAGERRRILSGHGCGGASPRTPRSRGGGASPKTPASGGGASPRTPTNGASPRTPTSRAASLVRRHSGSPKNAKSATPLARQASSCPRGWAPVCAVRVGGKGSPLRRGRTGSDTPAANVIKVQKRLVRMSSYKTRTPAEAKALPQPRIHRQTTRAPKDLKAIRYEDVMIDHKAVTEGSNDDLQVLSSKGPHRMRSVVEGGKAYRHGKRERFSRLQKEIEKGSFNG